ncbi:unnamed protein product [Microthlaspi erraticum]|uniref:Retrotransposon gag domain-containing protein n=1 Tax=Microthlaspi erraticum TaxID=1685480 RepID=A0A6D2I284_9BRAS|nr:unnamed protein product [Microthlaspi erraticum]
MTKDALVWFSNLPAESIDNFDDLTNAFMKHYSMHMTRVTRNMFTMMKAQGKSLREFMEKFKEAARDVADMPDRVPLEALRNGLWYDSKFNEDLSLRPPATLVDAFHRSRNYIFLDEDKHLYAENHGDIRTAPSKPREDAVEVRRRPEPKRSLLTSFAAADDAMTVPSNAIPLDDNDPDAFCHLHGNSGHSTRNCKHLARNLLWMYQQGELPQ